MFCTFNLIMMRLNVHNVEILQIVFYCFAIVGMEIFAGKVVFISNNTNEYCNNPALNGSVFVTNHYCAVNFNDILDSFVLIASLLIVNNWHDILLINP